MKTNDIQRGITSPHARSGDGPLLGRVARVRDRDAMTEKPPSRRRGRTAAHKRAVLIWSAVLSSATLVVLGLAVFFWVMPYLRVAPAVSAGIGALPDAQVRVASKFPSPSREQALDLVRRALANVDPEKVESYFRTGTATRAEILDFLKSSGPRDGPMVSCEWLSSMDVDGLLMEGVLVVYKGWEKPVERLAFLTPDSAGRWKLDFDAFARSVRPSWKELLENGAEQALVRVFVGRDVYYNGPFSDEKEWVCYCIASPDNDELLRGYCRVGSPLAAAMEELLKEEHRYSRATLEIRRVKEGGDRQFEITRLVAKDWVVADGPPTPQG